MYSSEARQVQAGLGRLRQAWAGLRQAQTGGGRDVLSRRHFASFMNYRTGREARTQEQERRRDCHWRTGDLERRRGGDED